MHKPWLALVCLTLIGCSSGSGGSGSEEVEEALPSESVTELSTAVESNDFVVEGLLKVNTSHFAVVQADCEDPEAFAELSDPDKGECCFNFIENEAVRANCEEFGPGERDFGKRIQPPRCELFNLPPLIDDGMGGFAPDFEGRREEGDDSCAAATLKFEVDQINVHLASVHQQLPKMIERAAEAGCDLPSGEECTLTREDPFSGGEATLILQQIDDETSFSLTLGGEDVMSGSISKTAGGETGTMEFSLRPPDGVGEDQFPEDAEGNPIIPEGKGTVEWTEKDGKLTIDVHLEGTIPQCIPGAGAPMCQEGTIDDTIAYTAFLDEDEGKGPPGKFERVSKATLAVGDPNYPMAPTTTEEQEFKASYEWKADGSGCFTGAIEGAMRPFAPIPFNIDPSTGFAPFDDYTECWDESALQTDTNPLTNDAIADNGYSYI